MRLRLVKEPFDNPDYLFELKRVDSGPPAQSKTEEAVNSLSPAEGH
jgi:hypothetical protein